MDAGWRSAKPRKKTQIEKKNEKRMRYSYFTQQYDAFGENFSNFLNPPDIRRDAFKIFRSLADCAIDLEKHYKCFEDPIFVNTLKDIAYEKAYYHHATQIGLETFINMSNASGTPIEAYIYNTCIQHQRSSEAYSLLYNAFFNIQLTNDYISALGNLMPILNKYRNSL